METKAELPLKRILEAAAIMEAHSMPRWERDLEMGMAYSRLMRFQYGYIP